MIAADVVDVAGGDRRPVDLRFQHLPLHRSSVHSAVRPITTLSISRALPTRAATATRTGRPLKLCAGARSSASRASRYSGSIPARCELRRARRRARVRVERSRPRALSAAAQRAAERRRALALVGVEVGVARAHREAVGLAHGRAATSISTREVEVARPSAGSRPPAGRPSGRSRRRRAGPS